MSSWRIALALVLLLPLSCRAARGQAPMPALAELVVPVEDLGPDWLLHGETQTRDESGATEFVRRYTFDPAGEATFALVLTSDEVAAESLLDELVTRAREQTGPGGQLPVESIPGLGDGQAFRVLEFFLTGVAAYSYRVGPAVATVGLGLGFKDPAWIPALAELETGQAQAQRYIELLTERARQYSALQETRLRLALARQPLPLPAAPHCGTRQVPRIHERFAAIVRALGERVGEPLECVHADPGTLDWVQMTSGGQLGWRKAEGVPTFSDVATTWLVGPDGLVARPNAGPLFAWEVARTVPAVLSGGSGRPTSLAWSPMGLRLAAGDMDGYVRRWDLVTGQPLHVLEAARAGPVEITWSPDGRWIAGVTDAAVQVWDADSGDELCSVTVNPPRPADARVIGPNYVSAAWSPDSRRLALPGWEEPVVPIVDATTCRDLLVLRGHEGNRVVAAAWSPDGAVLATGASDGTARLWDAATGQPQAVLGGHPSGWIRVLWSPAGGLLATYQFEGAVRLWDSGTGQNVRTLAGRGPVIWSLTGAWLATGAPLVIWDPNTGAGKELGPGTGGPPIVWRSDGAQVAAVSSREVQPPVFVPGRSEGIDIWEVATGHRQWLLRDVETVTKLAWSPDGRYLASSGDGAEIKLWDLSAGTYGSR